MEQTNQENYNAQELKTYSKFFIWLIIIKTENYKLIVCFFYNLLIDIVSY